MKRNGRKSLAGALARAKNESGFTLVELIVVIAILGILAGVGTVGYSGYIKKANMAADEILLDSLNTAFAAACIENGEDNTKVSASDITIGDDKTVVKADINVTTPAEKATAIQEDFASYYEGGTFKVITALKYNQSKGMFEDANGGETYTYDFAGSTVTISAADKAILSGDNAFSEMGAEFLLNEVGTLERLIELGAGDEILGKVKVAPDFLLALGSYAGLTKDEDESDEDYLDRLYIYSVNDENADAVYNAQVMYAASHAANATDTQIGKLFTYVEGEALTGRIEGNTDAETMTNAALAYGMYIAYAKQKGIDTTDVSNFTNTVNTEAFAEYVTSSASGQEDLEAYQAAMNMIGDNTSNSAVTSSILNDGIANNTALLELMKKIMGK